ncbi:MAG: hypothetical protein ACI4ES_14655 [Roseburia sp.]
MEKKKKKQWSTTEKLAVWLIGTAVITALFFVFRDGINGNDFWWHVKVGEWICTNKTVPKTDIFSWIGMEKGIDWTAHEWLSEVIFYLIYTYTGSIGMFVFALGMSICMMALLWKEVREYAVNNLIISGVYFAIYAVICAMFFYGRPHLFGFFLLYFELKCLYEFMENEDTKVIYFIPFITIAWSNLHGGSANLAYLLCILTLVISCLNFRMGRVYTERKKMRNIVRLGIVTVLSVLGILVNPIGIRVLLYPYVNLSDNLSMTVISEWHAPDAKSIGDLVIFLFRSSRFIVLWYIAAAFYAFQYMPVCKIKEMKSRAERQAGESKYPLHKMIEFAFDGITSFTVKPLRMISFMGILCSICSIAGLLYALISYFWGDTVPGWTAIVCSIWLLGGIQLLAIGVLGEYVGKIFGEVKKRPRYYIEEEIR